MDCTSHTILGITDGRDVSGRKSMLVVARIQNQNESPGMVFSRRRDVQSGVQDFGAPSV
jgi:hypothetical protein